ncbi:Predicted dithiol-disulfide isomerase, DsbA family [Desulfuromusa kysingii]|uniref:Predicted dithiol-disulfide isomerase, DsbA family n=1 Tax=Desulfuromusa kysingii TaxID=37625 RepID=A0A1H3W814_9BACT|nr:DsbA family oxidoreductase [Desulfuromusa kysingii]SDZ83235.1 Predicted dithiol-disulfide isomerase, DsbA family [Desulfuromusa kysingii]
MAEKIRLEIISDVVCPWCIIGYKRLKTAILEMGIEDKVELQWQPFEINPDMPAAGEEIQAYGTRKYGSTAEEGARNRAMITKLGEELEFKFDFFNGMKVVNTRDAHILLDYAKELGLQTKLNTQLFYSFFSDRQDISDRQILEQALQNVGLNVAEGLSRLDDNGARKRILEQEMHWYNTGISSVPTVIINRSEVLTGAQPIAVYKQILTEQSKLS